MARSLEQVDTRGCLTQRQRAETRICVYLESDPLSDYRYQSQGKLGCAQPAEVLPVCERSVLFDHQDCTPIKH